MHGEIESNRFGRGRKDGEPLRRAPTCEMVPIRARRTARVRWPRLLGESCGASGERIEVECRVDLSSRNKSGRGRRGLTPIHGEPAAQRDARRARKAASASSISCRICFAARPSRSCAARRATTPACSIRRVSPASMKELSSASVLSDDPPTNDLRYAHPFGRSTSDMALNEKKNESARLQPALRAEVQPPQGKGRRAERCHH